MSGDGSLRQVDGPVATRVTTPAPRDRGVAPPDGDAGVRARLAIVIVALLAVGAIVAVTLTGGVSTPEPAAAPAPAVPAAPALPASSPTMAVSGPLAVATPVRVRVPSIGAESSLIPVGVDAQNRMEVPPTSRPMQAAWYDRAPTPGAAGPAVVIGHVDGDGRPGVFAGLADVRPGQQAEVERADGTVAVFTVFHTETVPKDAFPTQRVYGNVPDAQLRLVTCGGVFDADRGSYESNVIVYAGLTGVRAL